MSAVAAFVDLDQRTASLDVRTRSFTKSRRINMAEVLKPQAISRRKALSLAGLAAAFGLAAATSGIAVTDAEAQTVGMERRAARRTGRHDRRQDRRTGRTERREERRN
jgi:hypothetical protein